MKPGLKKIYVMIKIDFIIYTPLTTSRMICFFFILGETYWIGFDLFFKFLFVFIYLVALGLCCSTWAFSSCIERGLLFLAVHGLLIAVVSLVAELGLLGLWASAVAARGLSSCGERALERSLSSCGALALLLRGMWDLPGPGLEPMSPALAGGFLTTAPPGKSRMICF